MTPRACSVTRAADALTGNRDRLLSDPARGLFLLADGMGTRPGAAAASSTAVATLNQALESIPRQQRLQSAALLGAVAEAQHRVRELPRSDPALAGAGTTLCAAVLVGRQGRAVHLGDSRILLYRQRQLQQLSTSHTVAAEVEHLGLNRAPGSHPLEHMLTRWLGSEPASEPQLLSFTLEVNDWLLLCSDGLPKILEDRELADLLATQDDGPVKALCGRLEELIDRREHHDDVSVILIRMESSGETDHE